MLKNYLTVALRNLRKHMGYTVLNVVGLAVGIACCLLIVLYVQDELSYDRFHENADRIVRVVQRGNIGGDFQRFTQTPSLLGPALAEAFPEVEEMVRLYPAAGVVTVGDQRFQEELLFVDPSFLDVFTFPLLNGDGAHALADRNGVVLSEDAAQKFFGDINPAGRMLSIRLRETFFDFTVRGVAAPLPSASSIRFDVLLPFSKLVDFDPAITNPSWSTSRPRTYLQLTESSAIEELQGKLPAFIEATIPSGPGAGSEYVIRELDLQRMTDIHLEPDVWDELTSTSNPTYAYLLGGLAFFILVLACINFTTLSLGRSVSRAQEVGIRKVVGALRPQLMKQFWGEALLISFVALLFGLVLAEGLLPVFNVLVGKSLHLSTNPFWLILLVGILLTVSLLAGSYPAIYLSRFHPIKVLKGQAAGAGKHRLTQVLVVIQFAVSIFLIISTLFMSKQLDMLLASDVGYDEDQVVRIRANYGSTWEGRRLFDRYQESLDSAPSVHSLTGSMYAFADSEEGISSRPELTTAADSVRGHVLNVTPTFLETLGIELVRGRDFSEDRPTDGATAVVVNETLVEAFGWDEPLGETLSSMFSFSDASVIGVVRDFHYESLHQPVQPVALYLGEEPLWHLYARIAPGDLAASLAVLESTWRAVAPDLPFEFEFLDQAVDRIYRSEQQWAWLIRAAAGIAIFIACLGLLGLAALAAAGRRKEIGIRQVLGASAEQIVLLLTRRFVLLILAAIAIAVPLAHIAMRRWLDDFAYRITLSPGVFLLAGLIAIGIAALTVSTQAVRAALANPADALRTE